MNPSKDILMEQLEFIEKNDPPLWEFVAATIANVCQTIKEEHDSGEAEHSSGRVLLFNKVVTP